MKNKRKIRRIQRKLRRGAKKLIMLELDKAYMRLPNFKYIQEKKDLRRREKYLNDKLTKLKSKNK